MPSKGRSAAAQSEVAQYLRAQVVRRRLFPRAVLTGLISGGVAVAFRVSLEAAGRLRTHFIDGLALPPFGAALVVFAIASLGTLISLTIGRAEPDAKGSGIPHMKAVLEGHAPLRWLQILLVKFPAAVVSIGSGLALGREGPTVQMGGAVGAAVSDFTRADARERRALIASGGGAGLAGAFNAPLAGVTFVLEELQRDFQPVVFGAALLAAAISTVVSRAVGGQAPVFQVPLIATPELSSLALFAAVGILAGVGGVAFNRALLFASSRLSRIRRKRPWAVALIVGAVVAVGFSVSPVLLGGGHELSEGAFLGQYTLLTALLFLVVRFVLVHVSFGSGVAGGIFAPILSLGALLGLVVYRMAEMVGVANGLPVAACAVAGMCGLFSGVVRAPLTGVILIGEMTGSYDLLLPLLVAAFSSYAVAEGLRDTPIYEAILQRDMASRGKEVESEPQIVEIEIPAGAPCAGKALRDLSMPEGLLIVQCRIGGKAFVPKGGTVLLPHMRIVLSASGHDALQQFREMALHPPAG